MDREHQEALEAQLWDRYEEELKSSGCWYYLMHPEIPMPKEIRKKYIEIRRNLTTFM